MLGFVSRHYRWYKLEFGLTMLSWWEVAIFSTCAVLSCSSYFACVVIACNVPLY